MVDGTGAHHEYGGGSRGVLPVKDSSSLAAAAALSPWFTTSLRVSSGVPARASSLTAASAPALLRGPPASGLFLKRHWGFRHAVVKAFRLFPDDSPSDETLQ